MPSLPTSLLQNRPLPSALHRIRRRGADWLAAHGRLRRFISAASVLLTLAGPLEAATATTIFEPVFDFAVPPAGPIGDLVQMADLSFLGTTSAGGSSGSGTVFKFGADGTMKTLAEFTGSTGVLRGSQPSAALVLAGDGNYYGVTALGGTNNLGTVFKVSPDGLATSVANFTGAGTQLRGSLPYAPLLPGGDGYLYGTTSAGGQYNLGTVFKLSEADGTITTLVEFGGKLAGVLGANPYAGLIKGTDGLLYGTTAKGGKSNFGTVFSITTEGVLKTLVEFSDNGAKNKGAAPYGPLTQTGNGIFHGTTARGGASDNGTVFQMTADGTLVTLLEFTGTAGRYPGSLPESALVMGPEDYLYGTTFAGGLENKGTIFKITSGGWIGSLVSFTKASGNRGTQPQSGLILAQDGNLYGTTFAGGTGDRGTIFRMSTFSATGVTTLLDFAGVDPATSAQGGVIQGRDTAFYGATATNGLPGKGGIYKITLLGVIKTLTEFAGTTATPRGGTPRAPLMQAADGNFYGVTAKGGAADLGTIFKLTSAGVLTTLVEFTGNGPVNKGASPKAALIQVNGDLYGVTSEGGAQNAGTIFRVTTGGTLTTLVEFSNNGVANKGASPDAALIVGSDGNLHGTTARGGALDLGTIFSMTPEGVLTTQVEFADSPTGIKGAYPEGPLVQAADGDYYGTTATGGAKGFGTIFRMTPAGQLTTLLEFTNTSGKFKGAYPTGALFQASDGNFYGTAGFGGKANLGTTFKMTPEGVFTTLADMVYADGAYPENGFIAGSDGNLYASASGGGTFGAGTVFRLRMRTATDLAEAAAVTPSSATLRARMEMSALASTVYFEYGVDGYDNQTPGQQVASGSASTVVTANLSGLLPNTVYFFRTVIVDSSGTTYGRDEFFTTGALSTEVISTGGGIAGEPATTVITALGVPSIADNQSVAVLANLTTAAGKETAILAGNPPVIVARKGTPAPVSAPGVTGAFTTFKDPVCDATGQVAFAAGITLEKKAATGLWTNAGGALKEVARIGGEVGGLPGAKFTALTTYAMSANGVVFYGGKVSGGGTAAANNTGLWACDSTGNHLLLRNGDLINGLKITLIAALGPVTGSTGQGRGYYGNTLTVRVTLSDKTQAIVQLTPGFDPIVIGPTPFDLPGVTPAATVKTLGVPSVSTSGNAAFLATLTDKKVAIVADSAAADLAVVARTGTAAAGTTGNFATFVDPVYNAQSNTAFLATLTGTGVTGTSKSGLWFNTASGLSLVARTGSPVPAVPAANWNSFVSIALPDNAGPVFLAKLGPGTSGPGLLSDVKATSNMGIWSVDAEQSKRLLVRTGQMLEVRGTARQLSLITVLGSVLGSSGQARNYNAAGDVVYRATFTDRTQAIMRIHLP